LVALGLCQPEDVSLAVADGAALLSPEYAEKIRSAERILRAISEPSRIKIILLLSKREMCVCELESALQMAQPTMSHHLGILERVGLLQRSKKERWVFYKLRHSPVTDLVRSMVS
jgi:DNA-binding transcriptional ArsR family regulator